MKKKLLLFYGLFFILFIGKAQTDSAHIIYQKYINVIGGLTNLNKVKTIKIVSNTLANNLSNTNEITYKVHPNFIRQEVTSKAYGQVITCWYLDSMLIYDPKLSDKAIHTSEALKKITYQKPKFKKPLDKPFLFNSLIQHLEFGFEMKYEGVINLEGKKYFHLVVKLDDVMRDNFFIDTNTYLLMKEHKENRLSTVIQKFSYNDYRDVSGVLFPFEIKTTTGDSFYTHKKVETIEVSDKIDNRLFDCQPIK
jgi:hypothetical protein